jgi:NAD(P)H-hydrate repair Nnr-like enzyme with NAD(P)H-hydrate dehydratase domain
VINLSVGRRAAPWLATAGSGDVLAGIVAGLLAQGYTPRNAASMATWLHTESARMFGVGMIAEDLLNGIPSALKRLYKDKTPHSSLV